MARNKYPQETVDKILQVALSLFTEQGYEGTTIQDIINRMGGLTKGAIYHHFKSKEDIFYAMADKLGEQVEAGMKKLLNQPGRTGLEKLRDMFLYSVTDSSQSELNATLPNLLSNPWLLATSLRSQITDVVPNYIYPAVLEGVADGSIHTQHPKQLAEVVMVIINIWTNPMLYPAAEGELEVRMRYCASLFQSLGLDLLDEKLICVVVGRLERLRRASSPSK